MAWRQGQSYSEDLRARVLAAVHAGWRHERRRSVLWMPTNSSSSSMNSFRSGKRAGDQEVCSAYSIVAETRRFQLSVCRNALGVVATLTAPANAQMYLGWDFGNGFGIGIGQVPSAYSPCPTYGWRWAP